LGLPQSYDDHLIALFFKDDQPTTNADASPAGVDTPQPVRVEQHATTADGSQPLEEAPNLAAAEQFVTPADACPPHEESFHLTMDEQYASPGDPCSSHGETINLFRDEQQASASFTAPPDDEVLETPWEAPHPPLQQDYEAVVNDNESPESAFNSNEIETAVDPLCELLELLIFTQELNLAPSDSVYHPRLGIVTVEECIQTIIEYLRSHIVSTDELNALGFETLLRDNLGDPLIRNDLDCYLQDLEGHLEQDNRYINAYNPNFLCRCGITSEIRNCVVQWMVQLHLWLRIPTQTLHVAVGLMDLYTWLQPILRSDYQLLALAAIRLASHVEFPEISISTRKLCRAVKGAYTPTQIDRMVETIHLYTGNIIIFPTPHTFLESYIIGFSDFSPSRLEWAKKVCKYFFDLGLCQDKLCKYSASLRCAGVLYLIRRMQNVVYTPDYGRVGGAEALRGHSYLPSSSLDDLIWLEPSLFHLSRRLH
uniref:CYCLIN domain-containing protein n=1 Tax=Hydatigena taeniaeformis TaxID=6205 RepID=A0A0R3WMF5_HYDTA